MGTKNTVYLISSGTNYYLSGGANTQTAYSGSGTPWTSESTSPYELSLNSYTPHWVAQPPPPVVQWSGGPPFSIGRRPVYRSYDNITEQVGVQMRGTTKDNAVFLLRQLRRILSETPLPTILAVQGGTNPGYTEIRLATIEETPDYIQEVDGVIRATITWTRHPFFSLINGGETLINAQSFTNSGSAGANTVAFSAGLGDMIYEGSPVNYSLTSFSATASAVWMASVASRTYDAGVSLAANTSSTTPVAGTASGAISATPLTTDDRVKARIILRLTSTPTSNFRIGAQVQTASGADVLWQSTYQAASAGVANTLIDLGVFDGEYHRRNNTTTGTFVVRPFYYSSDGSAASAQISSLEVLFYHDFCYCVGVDTFSELHISAFRAVSGRATMPIYPEALRGLRIGVDRVIDPRGTIPKYRSGDSLWLAWFDGTLAGEHTNTRTVTVTCSHAPMWHSVRGST